MNHEADIIILFIHLMAIFGENLKSKRVYLRRKSLKLQKYAVLGSFFALVSLAAFKRKNE